MIPAKVPKVLSGIGSTASWRIIGALRPAADQRTLRAQEQRGGAVGAQGVEGREEGVEQRLVQQVAGRRGEGEDGVAVGAFCPERHGGGD